MNMNLHPGSPKYPSSILKFRVILAKKCFARPSKSNFSGPPAVSETTVRGLNLLTVPRFKKTQILKIYPYPNLLDQDKGPFKG